MKHLDRILDDILALEPHEREIALRSRSQAERDALFVVWSESDRLRATDIVALPQPYQAELISFVCGDARRGRVGSGQSFRVAATNGPVSVERGMRANKRLYYVVDKPATLPADRAIHVLGLYGPYAEIEQNRGRVVELGPDDTGPIKEARKK